MSILDNLTEDKLKAMLAKSRAEGEREAFGKCARLCTEEIGLRRSRQKFMPKVSLSLADEVRISELRWIGRSITRLAGEANVTKGASTDGVD